ncbi:hypothetical protein AGMMS50239_09230 [Bacteroidia bacterium]|nr:hypothetical protein AGMMS50239_09230 [Bacteroidia bacterium]
MIHDNFQSDLKQAYNRSNWQQWLQDIFGRQINFEAQPEQIILQKDTAKSIERFASVSLADGKNIAVLDIMTNKDVQIARNRVALRELVSQLIDHDRYHGLLAFYHSEDLSQSEYRLSFISSEAVIDDAGNFTTQNTNPKRYTYVLGENESTRTASDRLKNIADKVGHITLGDMKEAFSVETLTKQFYKELFDWYQWALCDEMAVTYPNDTDMETDDRKIEEHLIRLITRLMFVWFIKQKRLIPQDIFDIKKLSAILKDFDAASEKSGNYYNAILQNLFFATLNRPISERAFASFSLNDKRVGKEHYGIKTLFRDANEGTWFKQSNEEMIDLFKQVPFLNGGLFECLDKEKDNNEKIFYYDGFSREGGRQRRAFLPNCLFFESEKGLISILKRYNFTIEENTPSDVEVALDPELLGKVFENLLGAYNPETKETARKQSGSFYTPREIVNYMVDESLKAYLQQCTSIDFPSFENLESLSTNEKSAIYNALLKIKILDPACGSGAFPMGILNRTIEIMERLGLPQTIDRFHLKLHLIENCIFGVDIQTIAVQISKLRFFISLVCEQTPNGNIDDNYGIKPLPNLETKFVAANTLIGLVPKNAQGNLFEDPQIDVTKKELLQIRHKHFSANTPKQKKECREEDKILRNKLAKLLETNGSFAPDDALQLAQWNPYDQNSTSPFFDSEWMFGLAQGFDIVIGNPPYVKAKKLKDIAPFLKDYAVATGTSDLSVYFIERGLNLCKPNCYLYYITTNKFFNTGYGKPVRKLLTNNQINKVIDFEQVEVFDNVLVSSVVIGIKKTEEKADNFTYQKFYKLTKADFTKKFVEKQSEFGIYKQSLLTDSEWSFSDNEQLIIKTKIENAGKKISIFNGVAVFRGVTTGFNPAFIIDAEKKTELIAADKANEQIIKPLLQGRNIRKWIYNEHNDFLVFTKQGIDIEKYPIIKNHLSGFYSDLKPREENETEGGRKPGSYKWFEIQDNTAYYPEFEKSEKIIWGLTADKWAYAYDDKQHYLPSNGYILTSENIPIKYLLGLLNSNLLKYYFGFIGVMTAGGAYTLKHATIQQLPIVVANDQQQIIDCVEQILQSKKKNSDTSKLENEIDQLVYELYGLTAEEIKIVEGKV